MNKITHGEILKLLAKPLGKRVDQKAIEQWTAAFWTLPRLGPGARGTAVPPPRRPFTIMFPPPNITGNLHLGHAMTGALQDALVRQRRMQGYECTFIPGFDHAGLATQSIVEKLLWKQKGMTRKDMSREEFIGHVNDWKDKKRSEMRDQLDRLGLDLNREREYFTMDENSSHAVQAAFRQLFTAGIIYRSVKPIYWSKQLQTTLSDIEVEEVEGQMRYVRTGEVVDKRPVSQWFISADAMARKAVEVVQNESIAMIPPNYKRSWSSWLLENGVHDWCISRQSWWGHRIPAFKLQTAPDVSESWIVADNLEEAKATLGPDATQDSDVLDTWFSSSLLPLTVSGWPDQDRFESTCREQTFPLHIMETGFDILTYWVSKMAMISLALTNRIPFKLVLLHGMICDSDGKKMSKSTGNVIDPLDVIDGATLKELQARTMDSHAQGILEDRRLQPVLDNQRRLFPKGIPACGADGLRAYLLSHDVQEEVVRVQVAQIDKVRRLSNKIWNIFRFFFALTDQDCSPNSLWSTIAGPSGLDKSKLDVHDQQVLSKLARCVLAAHESFNHTYQLHRCFAQLEKFMTEHLSQTYLEQTKDILLAKGGCAETRKHKLDVFALCLLTSTKLLHPFMPHLTEFLYQKTRVHNNDLKSTLERYVVETRPLSYEEFPRQEDWTDLDHRVGCANP